MERDSAKRMQVSIIKRDSHPGQREREADAQSTNCGSLTSHPNSNSIIKRVTKGLCRVTFNVSAAYWIVYGGSDQGESLI